jgi:hypothetical protein
VILVTEILGVGKSGNVVSGMILGVGVPKLDEDSKAGCKASGFLERG